ncbi:hypothetical protein BD410DRAFT_899377, partial [Rickenella mellea]
MTAIDGGHTPPESKGDLIMHHGGPSPIDKLPDDVLSQIFLACLDPPLSRPNIRKAPVILGRICRSWRRLALDMPLLWNYIVGVAIMRHDLLHDETSNTAELEKDILAWDEYLARSRSCPLEISMFYIILGVDAPPSYFVPKVSAIVLKILPHSQRWRNIVLDIPDGALQDFFSQFVSGVPRLRSLMVSESNPVHWGPTLRINLSSAHQLERLHIRIPTDVNWDTTIMHQMRDLNVQPTSVWSFLQCIDQCPSLTSVEFCGDVKTRSAPLTEIHTHRLSSLVKIRLDELNQYLFSGLLDSLHLPVLKQLDIRATHGFSDSSSFVRFMNRSLPPLEMLSIIAHGMRTADLLDCLQCIPRLAVLRIDIAYFSEDTIQWFLTPSPTCGWSVLCPNLTSLWLLGKTE